MVRPLKEIDWKLFEQLCALQCTQSEIASCLGVHIDTLRDRTATNYNDSYSNIYNKFSETGKCSLRRNQFVLSKKNAAVAIWLGKQWLGQKDISKEEAKSIAEGVVHGIREIQASSGVPGISGPALAFEQSLSYQDLTGQKDKVPNELGAKGAP